MRAWILLLLCATATAADGQYASLRGRVVVDSTEIPVAGVVVAIDALKLQTTSDSLGNFLLTGITPGAQIVAARKIGFAAFTTRMRFNANDLMEADLVLIPGAQALPDVKVEVAARLPARLVEFEERRTARAGGRFLTQDEFEKRASSLTSDVLRQLPGIDLMRDPLRGSAFYVNGGRMQMPRGAMQNTGFRPPPCFAAVVLDGAFVYSGADGEPPFNINSIGPAHIAGLEFYASPATIPARYNGTRNTCGLVVIWTR